MPGAAGPVVAVAVTTFHTADRTVADMLESFSRAARVAGGAFPGVSFRLHLVDNTAGGTDRARLEGLLQRHLAAGLPVAADILSGHGNVGFGAANNRALLAESADFLVVANPDLVYEPEAFAALLATFRDNPSVGLVTPAFVGEGGHVSHLCKRYPSFAVLFGRGFLPGRLRRLIAGPLSAYAMADRAAGADFRGPPIVTGAFMAFRRGVFQDIGGFDEHFFLYFEDFDISLRAGRVADILFAHRVRMRHEGGDAGRKGLRHVRLFSASAGRFWRKHGFRLWQVRDEPPRRA